MILPIYLYGQTVLRKEAEDVPADYPELKTLVANMFETMYHAEGVGLAGPQVGLSLQILVIDADVLREDFPECADFKRVMINPDIYEASEETTNLEEGCLSLPGIHERVSRAKAIRVRYMDENGDAHDEAIHGFAARVVQHECEHLDGDLFIDNCSPIRKQLIKNKLNNIIKGTVRCSYRVKAVGK